MINTQTTGQVFRKTDGNLVDLERQLPNVVAFIPAWRVGLRVRDAVILTLAVIISVPLARLVEEKINAN